MKLDKISNGVLDCADYATKNVANQWLGGEYVGHGLYFRAALLFGGYSLSITPLCEAWVGGDGNRTDEGMYRAYSAEKGWRVALGNFENGDSSAKQSLEEGLGYLGAIALDFKIPMTFPGFQKPRLLLTCSGLPEKADEAAMVETAVLLGNKDGWGVSHPCLKKILRLSDNDVFKGSLEPYSAK